MSLKQHFELLASYNKWMNARIYAAAARLGKEEIAKNRGAFFGSILGTLNHIVVGDTLWLKRFATLPSCAVSLNPVVDVPRPNSLDQVLFEDFDALTVRRVWLDGLICDWIGELAESDLGQVLHYRSIKGLEASKKYSNVLLHFFNHQTHHRGQVTTLLSQAGEDMGVTDLLALVMDESPA